MLIRRYLDKEPKIDKNAWIAESADVIGDVVVERGVSVWYGVVIRADLSKVVIKENSNVQDNCVIHVDHDKPTIIGKGVTVGHGAILHACEIGDNSLIGMGAIVLSGAKIGKNCIIGAGALIPEGKEIVDNSLVLGIPGKVIRKVTDEEVEKLKESSKEYLKLKKSHEAI
ncbi:MAG: gamma carbonic anhydrase family protein [Caldiserica bacterium]|nr:MAG: gamma carbonic anhydrase family protein [Caldisericota bacterium]